jgi:hypothetical protein
MLQFQMFEEKKMILLHLLLLNNSQFWPVAFTSTNSGWFETEEEAKAFLASHLSKQQAPAAPIVDQ